MKLNPALLCVALALPLAAQADETLTPRRGFVLRDPLRLHVKMPVKRGPFTFTEWVTFREAEIPPQIRALLEDPDFNAKSVSVYTNDEGGIGALGGTTNGDVPILDDEGQAGPNPIRLHSNVALYGREVGPNGQTMTRVSTGSGIGWMHPKHVTTGVPRPTADWWARNVVAPAFGTFTKWRGKRTFHPDGHMFRGTVTPVNEAGSPYAATAQGLRGNVLARIGGGAWELDPETGQETWIPDGISFALQIKDTDAPLLDETVGRNEQHLTLVSRARDWPALLVETELLSDEHSFFNNDFYPAIEYVVQGEPAQLRLIPEQVPFRAQADDRIGGVREAIAAGRAKWTLQVRKHERKAVYRGRAITWVNPNPWHSLAIVELSEELPDYDQDGFHISPALAGRGLREADTVGHTMRLGAYPASQAAREQGTHVPVDSAIDADPKKVPVPADRRGIVDVLND